MHVIFLIIRYLMDLVIYNIISFILQIKEDKKENNQSNTPELHHHFDMHFSNCFNLFNVH